MPYEFKYLSPQLVFIRWNGVASTMEALAYLNELTNAIEKAQDKIYFFSDLRNGYIQTPRVLQEMGHLTAHPHWGGGVALVKEISAEIFVRLFGRFVTPEMNDFVFDDVPSALARLERWQKGLTQDIDWEEVIPSGNVRT